MLAGLAATLSGCGATTDDGTKSRTPTDPTVTFAATTDTPTGTPSPTEASTETPTDTGEPTETPDEIGRAIRQARAELATALQVIDEAGLIRSGELVRPGDADYPIIENYGDVQVPVNRAQQRLDAVIPQTEERRETANALLLLGSYVELKLAEHANMGSSLNYLNRLVSQYPADTHLLWAGTTRNRMERATEKLKAARTRLDQIESMGGITGMDRTSVAAERREQNRLARIVREYLPATRGVGRTVAMIDSTRNVQEGFAVEEYESTRDLAKRILADLTSAREDLNTALDRGVRHHATGVRTFRCLNRGIRAAVEELQLAADAYEAGDTESGREHRNEADRLIASTETDCGRPLPL